MSVRLKRRINSKIAERKDPGGSFADEPPKFSLRYLQESHSIVRCTTEERLGFVDAMHKRRDIPWSRLETMPHGGLGCEVIRHGLRVALPSSAKGKSILSFRFSGKKAMVGFRERDVFYILWFDRDFSVYSHE